MHFFFVVTISIPLPQCFLFVFSPEKMLLFLIIVYEEAIKRLQTFLFPFSGHSSISVIFFWETGWAKWIECTRRARTINLYNGTVLFYLLYSTLFLMHSLILHAFISPSLQTAQMFSPSCSAVPFFFPLILFFWVVTIILEPRNEHD